MLAIVLVVVPSSFGFLIWKSYRDQRRSGFVTDGRLRWGDVTAPDDAPGGSNAGDDGSLRTAASGTDGECEPQGE